MRRTLWSAVFVPVRWTTEELAFAAISDCFICRANGATRGNNCSVLCLIANAGGPVLFVPWTMYEWSQLFGNEG